MFIDCTILSGVSCMFVGLSPEYVAFRLELKSQITILPVWLSCVYDVLNLNVANKYVLKHLSSN